MSKIEQPVLGEPKRRGPALVLLVLAGLAWVAMAVHESQLARPTIGSGRGIGGVRWGIILGSAAIGLLPPAASFVSGLLEKIRNPSPRTIRLASWCITFVAAGYFVVTAILQDRDLFPKTHDDCSYMIQMQMLARGRLWMPGHPLADFFDSFYLITRPVYASQYFPGTALLYVPTIWLHLPTWLMPALAAGAVVGLTYTNITELIDGAAGAIAALWVVSLSWFRMLSILLYSQVPALLLGLVLVWAWLRWRKSRRSAWLLLVGVAAGWAAITRPVDAICFALPVGVAILVDLIRGKANWAGLGLIVLGAAPFLSLQLVQNKGVTGHWFETPFRMYLDRDAPGTQMGFAKADPNERPQSVLLQKQEYYRNWAMPFIESHQPGKLPRTFVSRLPTIVDVTMPARVMLLLAFVGLRGLCTAGRWVVWGALPLFLLLYLCYPIFLEHYAIAVIPAVVLMCLLGVRVLGEAWPPLAPSIASAGTLLIVAACVTSLWEINHLIVPPEHQISDETFSSSTLRMINEQIPQASDIKKPAVILFRYHTGDKFFEEPVYNTDVAWPDDATIIRAHDLGPERDRQIVDYYAARPPVRQFYLFDLKMKGVIESLGDTSKPQEILAKLYELEPGGNK